MEQNRVQYYECHICLETAKDAVVTRCGHLYCWPCLGRWFSMCPHPKSCPVCTELVDEERLVPMNDGKSTEDPRQQVLPDDQ